MRRTPELSLQWVAHGTKLLQDGIRGLPDADFAAPTLLPGWTRSHLVAHLAANAEAIGHLVHWAVTGERTPMYSSPEQRNADIEAGSRRPPSELRSWFESSAERLAQDFARLDPEHWQHEVVTAQGRTVPASETPWMRAREVMVHVVDLDVGRTFADLPADFLAALGDDITDKRAAGAVGPSILLVVDDSAHSWEVRGREGDPAKVHGPLAGAVAWLAGRPAPDARGPIDDSDRPAPDLPAWL